MSATKSDLVQASHLARRAYLTIRQSTPRQVVENTESTRRQYALRERAEALGWPSDGLEVIDCDLGVSAAGSADREGFQRLVTEVTMGRAGIRVRQPRSGVDRTPTAIYSDSRCQGLPGRVATGIAWSSSAP